MNNDNASTSSTVCDRSYVTITTNPFLNYLQDYRSKSIGLSAKYIAVNGAMEWNKMPAMEKAKYIALAKEEKTRVRRLKKQMKSEQSIRSTAIRKRGGQRIRRRSRIPNRQRSVTQNDESIGKQSYNRHHSRSNIRNVNSSTSPRNSQSRRRTSRRQKSKQ